MKQPDPRKKIIKKENPATKQDSLALYNNSKKVDAYYKNNKDYEAVAFPDPVTHVKNKKAVDNYTRTNSRSINGSFIQNNIGVSLEDYYKKIDNNKYLQRESANSWLNMNAPMQLFDKRIKAREATGYKAENGTDFVSIANYNNIGNKPFDLLTDSEKKLRVETYGSDGVPKSYLNKVNPAITKQTIKPNSFTDYNGKGGNWKDAEGYVWDDRYPESDNYKKKPIQQRDKINSLQNNLSSAGLVHGDTNINADVSGLRPEARRAKYFNVQDTVHGKMGDAITDYKWNPSMQPMQELAPEPLNSRKITPQYAYGGSLRIDPPKQQRLNYENELMSKVLTERNKNLNWVQRGLNPSKYPHLTDDEGNNVTHQLGYTTDDKGNAYIRPNVVQDENQKLQWLNGQEANKYAKQTNTNMKVPDIQLAEYYSQNGLIKHAMGGNMKINRYAEGGKLTRFDEGGTHEQNPLGGIPQGQSQNGQTNTVEEGETKKKDYVYSDRMSIDEDMAKEMSLPSYIRGKTFANASKAIDNKFKDRTDIFSNETKNTLLDRLKQAQETLKQQEQEKIAQITQSMQANQQEIPDQMNGEIPEGMEEYMQQPGQNQMFQGGDLYKDETLKKEEELNKPNNDPSKYSQIGTQVGNAIYNQDQDKNAQLAAINSVGASIGGDAGKYVQGATGVYDMGQEFFGKSDINTSGMQKARNPNMGAAIGSGALKGAATGAIIGSVIPGVGNVIGGAAGAIVGGVAGLVGGSKDKRAARTANYNYALKETDKFTNDFADGGNLRPWEKSSSMRTDDPNYVPPFKKDITGSADYNTNFIKNFHDAIGISSAEDGYGTHLGLKTAAAYNDWNKTNDPSSYLSPKDLSEGYDIRDNLYGKETSPLESAKTFTKYMTDPEAGEYRQNLRKKLGVTTEGYKFNGAETPTINSTSKPFVEPTGVQAGMEAYYNSSPNKVNPVVTTNTDNKKGSWLDRNGGKMLKYAPVAMNAYQLSQLKRPENKSLDRLNQRYKPEYVDERSLQNIAGNEMTNTINSLSQVGGSEGQTRAAILGAGLNKAKGLSEAYANAAAQNRATNSQGQQFNTNLDQFNARTQAQESQNWEQNAAAYRNEKSKYLGAIGTDVGQIGKEEVNKNQIAEALGYTWDGKYMVDKKTGQKMTLEQLVASKKLPETTNSTSTTTTTNAYGGYLRMNKIGRR